MLLKYCDDYDYLDDNDCEDDNILCVSFKDIIFGMSEQFEDEKTHMNNCESPIIYPKYSWQIKTDKYFNFNTNLKSIVLSDKLEKAQKWITFQTRYNIKFPLQTIAPKIQQSRVVKKSTIPKDVAIYRKRKKYSNINFYQLLKDAKIDNIQLYPIEIIEKIYSSYFKSENIYNLENFLPLHWFDNKDFDEYNEIDWINLGKIGNENYPLPALGCSFDIEIKDWYIYKNSKIFKFLKQIQLRMENSLQFFIENSITSFINILCNPCNLMKNISNDFTWKNDFIKSEFQSEQHSTIFYVILNINDEFGAHLSTNPNDFLPALLNFYETSLIFAKNLYLYCGDHIEELFHLNKKILIESYTKAIIPLISYTKKYNQFCDLYNFNIPNFITKLKNQNQNANNLKQFIINYKNLKENLIEILPENIIIGPFFIDIQYLKNYLIQKYDDIINAILIYYTERMKEINENLYENLNLIFNKLTEKSNSVEHLLEIKIWYDNIIPNELDILNEKIKIMNFEYNILDYFLYNLTNEQFNLKWQTYAYPLHIKNKINEKNEQYKIDIEIFKKVQINDLIKYKENIEILNGKIIEFQNNNIFDLNKIEENELNVKKLMKSIGEMEILGELLWKRQKIFELNEFSLEQINTIKLNFQPYYDLWTTFLLILKLQEYCIVNPMQKLNIIEIKNKFELFMNVLKKLNIIFNEQFEIKNIIMVFIEKINNFSDKLEILELLKNDQWSMTNWMELNIKGKLEIKYSPNINLQYCIKKGILKHIDLIREIAKGATQVVVEEQDIEDDHDK
ncbi:dynein axonemal heavy chain 1 [Condylostylus longicornis]|uniref:dynein axonemal heavy chain 1 n=1 Tax=Condylostylus longicornis TaxID=2530218 RepID=UPI00244E43E7|nr:dynein axonemal heavy chain 1 [Condylostylus longicornis]